jgi:hypothetical protein
LQFTPSGGYILGDLGADVTIEHLTGRAPTRYGVRGEAMTWADGATPLRGRQPQPAQRHA